MDSANAANGCRIPSVNFILKDFGEEDFMQKRIAKNKLIVDGDGKMRYQFFCDLSGALEYTSKPVNKNKAEKELENIWENEAKEHFNFCKKCGRWVDSVMLNADVLECVACAPWEDAPKFCPHCGKKVENEDNNCAFCGKSLRYEGEE